MTYFIGQRVLIDGCEIAVVIPHPRDSRAIDLDTKVWVRKQDGVEQFRSTCNVNPLPGGQL